MKKGKDQTRLTIVILIWQENKLSPFGGSRIDTKLKSWFKAISFMNKVNLRHFIHHNLGP